MNLVVKYLVEIYCICVFWNSLDDHRILSINFNWNNTQENYTQMIWLKYDAFEGNQTNIDDLVRMGIDKSCQV